METQSAPDLLTVAEFIRKARVSKSTAARWRRNGIGPHPIKTGPRAIRYRAREVDDFLGLSRCADVHHEAA
jgi:predicted DNA-binding transcriptional regulator AlpA